MLSVKELMLLPLKKLRRHVSGLQTVHYNMDMVFDFYASMPNAFRYADLLARRVKLPTEWIPSKLKNLLWATIFLHYF